MATDALQIIVDLLKDNWNKANTDSIKPTIDKVFNKKRVGGFGEKTIILVYSPSASEERPISLGYGYVDSVDHVSIDIRSSVSYAHVLNCVEEVRRIIHANRKTHSTFDLIVLNRINDLSDGTRKLWRFVIDIDLISLGKNIAT